MHPWPDIETSIRVAWDATFTIESNERIGGGSINECYLVRGQGRTYFVKLNRPAGLPMFEAEAAGLSEIARSKTVRVPQPVCAAANGEASWLVLEYVALGQAGVRGMRELGRQLARMHRVTAERFGWHRDNTIGATPQVNTLSADWIAFWRQHRLGYQLDLAARNGHRGRLQQGGERLLEKLSAFFTAYRPRPSLLHGDLWGGNAGFDAEGKPLIYDPAVYYGDREADLAMTELFGGFTADFYSGYREEYALNSGYPARKHLYNLYHVLNHLNLFGGAYGAQAERMIDQLLAQA